MMDVTGRSYRRTRRGRSLYELRRDEGWSCGQSLSCFKFTMEKVLVDASFTKIPTQANA
jgi:hypothetical protein